MEYKNKENGIISIDHILIKEEPVEALKESVGDIAIKNKLDSTEIDELDTLAVKKNIKKECKSESEVDPLQFLDIQIGVSDQRKIFKEKYKPKCTICNETFHNDLSRDMHMYIHSNSNTFKCLHKGCEKEFHHRTHLFRHVQIYHPTETGIRCSICNAIFNSSLLLDDHMQKHRDEKRYTCSLCSKSFKEKYHLTNHWVRVHKNKAIGLFSCKHCSANFTDKELLNEHANIHLEGKNLFTPSVTVNSCRKVITCENIVAHHNKDSNINIENVTNELGNEYDKDYEQSVKLKKYSINRLTTLYKCHICNQAFIQKLNLVRHFKTHSKPNMPVGEKITKEKELIVNEDQKFIVCDVKDREIILEQKLIQHKKEVKDHFSQSDLQKIAVIVEIDKEDNSHFLSKDRLDKDKNDQLETTCKRKKLQNVFRCELCIAIYGTNRGLMKHISQTHKKHHEGKLYMSIKKLKYNKTKKRKSIEDSDISLEEARCIKNARKKPQGDIPLSFNESFNETIWTMDVCSNTTGLVLEYKGPNGWRLTNIMRLDSIISDNYYYSPEGKKFRSVNEIERYCDEKYIKHDMWKFVFSMRF